MATLNDDELSQFLKESYVDDYWDMVRSTFERVFDESDFALVDRLRDAILKRPEKEQVLFYHAEPLAVAAGLLGARAGQLKASQYTEYAMLVKAKGRDRPAGTLTLVP